MPSKQLLDQARKLIPPLNSKLHKGQAGRVGILGGSKNYTGAPFYAAMSAMRLGCDLAHIICDPDAGTVIKGYSPDLIVHPICQKGKNPINLKTELKSLLSRFHTIIIGPGLGRDEYMLDAARITINLALNSSSSSSSQSSNPNPNLNSNSDSNLDIDSDIDIDLIIDADGLYLISKEPELIVIDSNSKFKSKSSSTSTSTFQRNDRNDNNNLKKKSQSGGRSGRTGRRIILTPNVVEFERLCKTMNIDSTSSTACRDLARSFNGYRDNEGDDDGDGTGDEGDEGRRITICQKGEKDVISNGIETIFGDEPGGLKRCGGQGDVLSGTMGTMAAWGKNYIESDRFESSGESSTSPSPSVSQIPLLTALAASTLTRRTSRYTFDKFGRAMQTSDMLNLVGKSYETFMREEVEGEEKGKLEEGGGGGGGKL